jgi:glycosyltransferase involved in cell wall biosynthesis
MGPRFSVVIPAYNEERYLPRLLDSIDVATAAYPGGAAAVEVIVADNASTDATASIAASRGCVVAPVEKRCIAAARNGGARRAQGEFLCFVDADTRVHARTFAAIDEALSDERVVVGATGMVAERTSPGIAFTMGFMTVVVHILNLDAGVVYCRRPVFETVGGYDEDMQFAEDVRLLLDLKKHGRFRRARGAPATMSTRKFDRYGDWHMVTMGPGVLWSLITTRGAISNFARHYWYDDRR